MRIPTGNFGNVLPQAQPTRVDVGNSGAIGDAVAQLGRAGLGVAEDIQQRQEQDNQNALQALSTAGGAQVNKLLYDPETGMTATRKGINAVGATNDTLKEWTPGGISNSRYFHQQPASVGDHSDSPTSTDGTHQLCIRAGGARARVTGNVQRIE